MADLTAMKVKNLLWPNYPLKKGTGTNQLEPKRLPLWSLGSLLWTRRLPIQPIGHLFPMSTVTAPLEIVQTSPQLIPPPPPSLSNYRPIYLQTNKQKIHPFKSLHPPPPPSPRLTQPHSSLYWNELDLLWRFTNQLMQNALWSALLACRFEALFFIPVISPPKAPYEDV